MNKTFLFIVVLGIVLLYIFLGYELVKQGRDLLSVLLLFLAILLSPLPLTVFIAFVFSAKKINIEEKSNILTAVLSLIVGFIISFLFMMGVWSNTQHYTIQVILPLFVNASMLSLYILNFFHLKSSNLAGFITGLSMANVIYIIFK